MEFYFAPASAGVVCRHSAAITAGARRLCAVWRLDPHTRQLEMRWTRQQAHR
jgi:hypothetical protein